MNKHKKARTITTEKYDRRWHQYNQLAGFIEKLDRLPDSAGVKKNKTRSAPLPLVPMVF